VGKAATSSNNVPDLSHFKLIPLLRVDKAPWNYKKDEEDRARALTAAIRRSGQIVNINVRWVKDDRWEVLDGNHRLDSLRALGYKKVLAYDHGAITEKEAQRIAIELNEHRFGTDERQFNLLLKDMQLEFSVEDLALTLPPSILIQETHYREDYDYDALPDPVVTGDNEVCGRFILVYNNQVEKELFMELLDLQEDRVVNDINDFPLLKEIAETEVPEEDD